MIWGAIVGGVLGTMVLTTALRAASELGLTRIDLPFLLGTAVTADRIRAKVVGYGSTSFWASSSRLRTTRFSPSLIAAGSSSAQCSALSTRFLPASRLVNILLPAVHPRMGTGFDAAGSAPVLEPPGFMLVNYGRETPVAMILSHVVYGAIVGGFSGLAG